MAFLACADQTGDSGQRGRGPQSSALPPPWALGGHGRGPRCGGRAEPGPGPTSCLGHAYWHPRRCGAARHCMALGSPAQPPGGERAQVGLRPGPPQGRRGASVTVAMGRVPLRPFQGTCCVGADSAVQTVPAARQPCPPGGPCTGCEVHFLQDYQFLGNFGASKGRLVISQVLKKKNWVFQIPSEWQ